MMKPGPKRKPLVQRLLSRVEVSAVTGCWLYQGCRLPKGYGLIGEGGDSTTGARQLLAHRVSWEIHRGQIPEGMNVLHRCDVPACVNPEHLFLGTQKDNMRDCSQKKRLRPGRNPGERNGSAKLTREKIAEMRKLYEDGLTQTVIGNRYGITQTQVSRIVRGLSWT